jgi:hypothetical protein
MKERQRHPIWAKNHLILIEQVSYGNLLEFNLGMLFLKQSLSESKLTLSDIYSHQQEALINLADHLLFLHGLDPKALTVNQKNELLMGGILEKIDSPPSDKESTGKQSSIDEAIASVIAALIQLDLANDLDQAHQMIGHYPMDYIDGIINAKAELSMSPEQRKQRDQEDTFKSMAEEIKDKGINTFMGGQGKARFVREPDAQVYSPS